MIEETIRDWVNRYSLSDGDNVSGFLSDLDAAVFHQAAFESYEVDVAADPLSKVNVVIVIKPSVDSVQAIADALTEMWEEWLNFHEFQATSVRWHEEAAVMRFVTGVPSAGLGVTGTFIAGGRQYPALVQRFRTEYGMLGDTITALPGGLPEWAARRLRAP